MNISSIIRKTCFRLHYGFSLIEVTSSLLIFAIGGSIALTVFSFNASERIRLNDDTEAKLIATNILSTLILYERTSPVKLDTSGSPWPPKAGVPAISIPGGNWKNWRDVPAQQWSMNGTIPFITQIDVSYNSLSEAGQSFYQYNYSVNDSNYLSINRKKEDFTDTNTLLPLVQGKKITVAVTWPSTQADINERHRVLVTGIVQDP